jgi:hypothetical protein
MALVAGLSEPLKTEVKAHLRVQKSRSEQAAREAEQRELRGLF